MSFVQRIHEIAHKANTTGMVLEAINEIFSLCTPEMISLYYNYAVYKGKVDNQGVRTILWGVMITQCYSSRNYLKPYDMSPHDPEFLAMTQAVEFFITRPNGETFRIAKHSLNNFITNNWVQRPTLCAFLSDFTYMTIPICGYHNYFNHKMHMNALMDGKCSEPKKNEWRLTQFFHAMTIFKLPTDGSPMPKPFDHMLPVKKEIIDDSLAPYSTTSRNVEAMANQYVRNYVQFVQSFIVKDAIKTLFTICRRPSDPEMPHTAFISVFSYRVIVMLADPTSRHYGTISSLAQTFLLERFYDNMLQTLFHEAVAHLGPSGPEHNPCHTVRAMWEKFPPPLVTVLANAHAKKWMVYYMGLLTGL